MKDYDEIYQHFNTYKDKELNIAYDVLNNIMDKRRKEREFNQTFIERKEAENNEQKTNHF